MQQRTVGILVFDGVEVLDFCGPFEVFATTTMPDADPLDEAARPFRVLVIAERLEAVRCYGGLLVQPHHTIEDHPPLDILVVPGGYGTRREVNNGRLLDWIAAQDARTELTTSVCTGAFLLAARGLLDGRPATTHWASIERLRTTHPTIEVREEVRFVDDGRVLTSAGVSAGIDLALHVVGRLLGEEVARHTARRMEYEGYRRDSAP
jgi:transcriptional regulator GlxA family with amidase domain